MHHHLLLTAGLLSCMEAKEYAILFVLDVLATVVGIFLYIGIGGSF
jgi:hypothetical protein